ncbi:MAG TPA: glucose-6-phosphate dehydrogenase assembly protein OpcA [Herpetosiphonaceae bacterium]
MDLTETPPSKIANLAGIEDELRRQWQDIAEAHAGRDHVVTRVCTMTLIAYGADAELAKRVRKAAPAVYQRHPCRAILIEADGQPGELGAWVATVCQMPSGGEQQVCCEQITFTVGEEMRRRLPGAVLPLVMPDLPIFLWWPGPLHPASNVRTQLYAHADRWIIDSADFAEPLADLARLHGMLAADTHTAASDLAWARLTPWRATLARIFDHPAARPALDALTTVTINAKGRLAGGLLSVGWLASSLGWTPVARRSADRRYEFGFSAPHGEVAVTLAYASERSATMGDMSLASQAVPDLRINVGRTGDGGALACQVTLGEETLLAQAGAMRPSDDGTLLNEELNMHGHDRTYEKALAMVARLAALPAGQEGA